ncbi:MAG: 3-phosphoshikimate 1-carboxyvinyltransferase [Pseudomonadota bacterium]|nr:3-phosphoshikimate 1-carboxyvinyltransferase [Pseudomonadota bacterium]
MARLSAVTDRLIFTVRPGGVLRGAASAPGDKSISHRAVMLGGVADGVTRVTGYLDSADVRATVAAMRAMGVRIDASGGELTIEGRGGQSLAPPAAPLDLGNSGTAMRLLAGLLAGQRVPATLVGDASLSRRPMGRIIEPLRRMGANVRAEGGVPPVIVGGSDPLKGIEYRSPVASAQVKSAVLLAALGASGTTRVIEPKLTRDHTERMLRDFGCRIEFGEGVCQMEGPQALAPRSVAVPGDLSSAAFFLVGSLIAPGGDVTLRNVGVNPTRTGVIDILRLMGAQIKLLDERVRGAEPVADIRAIAGSLRGIEVPENLVSLAIDVFPVFAVAAACASGETRICGAEELRVKESDRIATTAAALRALGGEVIELDDGMIIRGGGLRGGRVDSAGDHRIAMASAIAALACEAPVTIGDCANVATSFPDFVNQAEALGLRIRADEAVISET